MSDVSERGLLDISHLSVRRAVLNDTIEFLKEVGTDGFEGFVLWGGQIVDKQALSFTSAVVPDQRSIMTEKGLLVFVDGEALFKVNKTLYERGEILAGQVHTHPKSAYHSSTDDHFPMVTLLGSLSLVIPDFARNAPADIKSWAWYRLGMSSQWEPLSSETRVTIE